MNLSTYDFSNLYTTLPHNLIKEKLLDLIESPRPIETPDERSKRRICVVLTPDCGSFRWIRRHFRWKFFRPGNKNVYYKYEKSLCQRKH